MFYSVDRLSQIRQTQISLMSMSPSCTMKGGGTWGHYLIQSIPRIMFVRKHRPNLKFLVPSNVAKRRSPWRDALEIAGIKQDALIGVEQDVTYKFRSVSICDYLWDFSSTLIHPFGKDLLSEMWANSKSEFARKSQNEIVFLQRDAKYGRSIENFTEIRHTLSSIDVTYANLTQMSVRDQISLFERARVVIGTLGSDLAGIVFCRPDTHILAISPVSHPDQFFYNLAAQFSLRWSEISVDELVSSHRVRHRANFRLPSETFCRALHDVIQNG